MPKFIQLDKVRIKNLNSDCMTLGTILLISSYSYIISLNIDFFTMDREAWSAVIHGVAKSQTWLSDWMALNWSRNCKLKYVELLWGSVFSWKKNFKEYLFCMVDNSTMTYTVLYRHIYYVWGNQYFLLLWHLWYTVQ